VHNLPKIPKMKNYIKRTKAVKIEIVIDENNQAWIWIWNSKHNVLNNTLQISMQLADKLAEQLEISPIKVTEITP